MGYTYKLVIFDRKFDDAPDKKSAAWKITDQIFIKDWGFNC